MGRTVSNHDRDPRSFPGFGGDNAALPGLQVELARDEPMRLDSGQSIGPFTAAYTTCGDLNSDKSNAVLVCHALTGDQYVLENNPVTGKPGWWELMVGPGKPLDTDRYFIICVNVLAVVWALPVRAISTLIRASRGGWIFQSSRSATWSARRRCCWIIWGSISCSALSADPWARCRYWNGRLNILNACSLLCQLRAPQGIPPRTSPFTRSAGRQSWQIPTGARGTTCVKA